VSDGGSIVDPWSVEFVDSLIREFRDDWVELLRLRRERRRDPRGELQAVMQMPQPDGVADPAWRCRPAPVDLVDRRVEITGPGVDPKMMITAMNSGASGYMVDGEDSLCPTWANVLATQRNLWDLARGRLQVEKDGVVYRLAAPCAVLHYRPRGLHLEDAAWTTKWRSPASLIDAGLFVYHNARALLDRGSGVYLYLPKLETEDEARFWGRVADWMEDRLVLPRWTVRFTVLVETLPALLRLESIVWELRERLTGLNVGRWDYIFSCLKTLGYRGYVLPDRRELTMSQPQLVEYARWVVNVAHRRGCHAIGGMAANVPNRRDVEATRVAMMAVEVDKFREVGLGHDGTWVAHPDLVAVARLVFDSGMGGRVEQMEVVPGPDTLNVAEVTSAVVGEVTLDGVREAVRSVLVYLDGWLGGNGCVAMAGKMEDVATAEISRALLWSWGNSGVKMACGESLDVEKIVRVVRGETAALVAAGNEPRSSAVELLISVIRSQEPPEFITLPAYEFLLKA